ncbi:hypothetical protein HYX02_00165 [Candidatus Woesearchaeota archaeon]|nr:hypothetical protein [Candidatus Woesearchaeota archaeon]
MNIADLVKELFPSHDLDRLESAKNPRQLFLNYMANLPKHAIRGGALGAVIGPVVIPLIYDFFGVDLSGDPTFDRAGGAFWVALIDMAQYVARAYRFAK